MPRFSRGSKAAGLEDGLLAGVGELEAEWLGFCPEGSGWRRVRALYRRAARSACDDGCFQHVSSLLSVHEYVFIRLYT